MEFARAKFEEDINEGLMLKMSLGDFKAKYGEHRAVAALAVIVEDELVGKKSDSLPGYDTGTGSQGEETAATGDDGS